MTVNERAQYIYNKLRAVGMTHAGAIGMIGNLQGESSTFDPMACETSYLKKFGLTAEEYVRRADNDEIIYNGKKFIKDSAGFGIVQWTYWARKQNLLNYAKANGKSVGDLDVQIDFMVKELKESYTNTWKTCSTTEKYSDAVKICVTEYEKPAKQQEAIKRRTEYAKNWAGIITGQTETTQKKENTGLTEQTVGDVFDRKKVIALAKSEIGYLEKKSADSLDDKTANAGMNNYTKYARDLDAIGDFYNGKKNGYAWCDVFVDWLFVTCFGVENALKLLCAKRGSSGAGCTYSLNYFKAAGRYHTRKEKPEVGDQIFFGSVGDSYHTGIVYAVDDSNVYTVEGNTSGASGVVSNGGGVCAKQYSRSSTAIAGYGRPAYNDGFTGDSVEENTEDNTEVEQPVEETKEETAKVTVKEETAKETEKTETVTIKKGDLVKISNNAYWYSGGKVSSWLINIRWYVLEASGDRVVIDKSEDGSRSIMSPINVKYLTLVKAAESIAVEAKKDNVDAPIPSKTQFDRQKLLDVAFAEVGYLEKKSESSLDDRTANAGAANFTKYARDLDAIKNYYYHDRKQGLNWCDIFCDWCFVQAYGIDDSFTVNCQPQYSYGAGCPQSMNYYKKAGRLDKVPQVGDQFFLSDGNGSTGHTGLVVGVNGSLVETIEGNQELRDGVEGVVKKKRTIAEIEGFGHPMYNDGWGTDAYIGKKSDSEAEKTAEEKVEEKTEETKTEVEETVVSEAAFNPPVLKNGDDGTAVKKLQALLLYSGYSVGSTGIDGDFGSATESAVKKVQSKLGRTQDGKADAWVWAELIRK